MIKILFLPIKVIRTFVRLAGVRGALLLLVGVGIGLLVAPTSGARLRAKLQARISEAKGGGDIPADADLVV